MWIHTGIFGEWCSAGKSKLIWDCHLSLGSLSFDVLIAEVQRSICGHIQRLWTVESFQKCSWVEATHPSCPIHPFHEKKFLWFQTQAHHLSLVLKYVAGRCLWYLCSDLSKGKIREVSSSLQQFIRQVFITSGHLVAVHWDRHILRLNFPVRAEDASSLNHAVFSKAHPLRMTCCVWLAFFPPLFCGHRWACGLENKCVM